MPKLTTKQLQAEQRKIEARLRRRRQQNKDDEKRLFEIGRQLHRIKIAALVGVPGAVRVRYRCGPGHREAKLNDQPGTVVEVRRTRASVDFGEHGRWSWPLEELLPSEDANDQGFQL